MPVEGLEAPWGMAQIVFIYDTARVSDPPRSMAALLAWAEAHPGRFTYPAPPDFTGTTFLKQALYELTADPARLAKPVSEADFAAATAPLWAYLDKLHPLLWRHGQQFPRNSEAMRQALDDGEIDIAFNFNPGEASSAIAQGLLPATVRSYVFDRGSIANTHFLAIPFDANAKAGAMIVANFLMSPEAQARKQDPAVWGDPTVLDVAALDPAGAQALRRSAARRGDLAAGEARPHLAGARSQLDDATDGRMAPALRPIGLSIDAPARLAEPPAGAHPGPVPAARARRGDRHVAAGPGIPARPGREGVLAAAAARTARRPGVAGRPDRDAGQRASRHAPRLPLRDRLWRRACRGRVCSPGSAGSPSRFWPCPMRRWRSASPSSSRPAAGSSGWQHRSWRAADLPDLPIPGDRLGLTLAAGLWLKETPFLLLAVFAGMNQLPVARFLDIARSLGYGPATAWLKVILPILYGQLRLPIYAVLAFSLSVVDMALILGPTTPPTLATLLLGWFDDPSLEKLLPAAAGGMLQLLLAAAAILLWRLGEVLVARIARFWLAGGGRGHRGGTGRRSGRGGGIAPALPCLRQHAGAGPLVARPPLALSRPPAHLLELGQLARRWPGSRRARSRPACCSPRPPRRSPWS